MDGEINEPKHETQSLPSVNSSDPNERKLARRKRIHARLEAAEKTTAMSDGTYVEPEEEQPLLQETIETSEDTLRQLYLEGKELVSNIIVASDAKEVARRETESKDKSERLEKLQEESALALQKLDEISSKWEAILDTNGPLELFECMKEQKAKCLDLIEQKNSLIKSFQMELKLADEKFMKGSKAMYEELGLLTRRIDEQVLLMRKAYRIELNQIEDSVAVTRAEITSKHQNLWQSLYNQREKDETTNMNRKFELVESFHEELYKLHKDHEEKYRRTRIQLETDIQILEQELEQVKALCLLNSEKLDYNYQVLKKREEENVYIKIHQKRRLNKLQDMVNNLKKKIDEKSQSTEEEYKRLTKDVNRYYANVLDTEKKAQHFSEVNDEKFNNIWKMKEEEAKDLMDKIFTVDMIIHEQILGVPWIRPTNTEFSIEDLPSYKTAVSVVNDYSRKKRKTRRAIIPEYEERLRKDDNSPEVLEGHKRLLCHILELIADQSGFLMEEKLDKLLQPYSNKEKTFVSLDNVFVAIDIRREKDVETLKEIFYPYTVCLYCEEQRETSVVSNEQRPENRRESDSNKERIDSKQPSILHIRELEEKVSKLRLHGRTGSIGSDRKEDDNSKHSLQNSKKRGSDLTTFTRDSRESVTDPIKTTQARYPSIKEHPSTPISAQRASSSRVKCDITHPLIIEKFNVLKALKDFVSFYHDGRMKVLLGIEEKLNPKRFTISRLLSEEDVIIYWEKYREVIPAALENVWDAVFSALKRYLTLLQGMDFIPVRLENKIKKASAICEDFFIPERHELNEKVKALTRQNQDLKRLVAYYKPSDSCREFKLPTISSVPDEPIDPVEIANIVNKLFI